MKLALFSLFGISLLLQGTACDGGFEVSGGGSTHVEPKQLTAGESATLSITLSKWGGNEDASESFTDVVLHYRLDDEPVYLTKRAVMTLDEGRRATFETIVPLPPSSGGRSLLYYFEYDFDGHANSRGSSSEPLEVNVEAPATRPTGK